VAGVRRYADTLFSNRGARLRFAVRKIDNDHAGFAIRFQEGWNSGQMMQ
jgi:hypothetical protein